VRDGKRYPLNGQPVIERHDFIVVGSGIGGDRRGAARSPEDGRLTLHRTNFERVLELTLTGARRASSSTELFYS
jgi:hypothetical protein